MVMVKTPFEAFVYLFKNVVDLFILLLHLYVYLFTAFKDARGPEMERANYLQDLREQRHDVCRNPVPLNLVRRKHIISFFISFFYSFVIHLIILKLFYICYRQCPRSGVVERRYGPHKSFDGGMNFIFLTNLLLKRCNAHSQLAIEN